jgi:ADP-heptose:LPS heptosyltransferase
MGDVIMMEPVMEYFYNKNYRVVLDCTPSFYNLFYNHFYKVEHVAHIKEDMSKWRVINLDMAYEVQPKALVLESYFKIAGVANPPLRNPMINPMVSKENKLFDKYVVLHIADTKIPHRNIQGIDWVPIVNDLKARGYVVIQVGIKERGHRPEDDVAPRINTQTENFLAYVIGGADLFIGNDSGCAHIAVACGVKSVIFFGSVKPEYRYHDLSKITVIQEPCEFAGCYHEVVSERGVECRFNKEKPPCVQFTNKELSEKLKALI